jgi:dihydropteroate synthase-like protein
MPARILFVTGKLAEPSLRRVLAELAPKAGFEPEVAVLPITVAALMTTDWVGRRLRISAETERVILPGYCRGEVSNIPAPEAVRVEKGPKDLRDLPQFFGTSRGRPENYGLFDIEIVAEVNHAPNLTLAEIVAAARQFGDSGADVIDLGCNPGETWAGIGEAVRALRDEGLRVSVDSFNENEVEAALAAGAELLLSVNSTNRHLARGWHERFGAEVVAIPDTPTDLDSLDATLTELSKAGVRFRVDPIVEPIGFGFAASLGRFIETRRRYPDVEIMMGVGNLTELTDVDSAGINVMLAGFCQELGIRSVLTTAVINWCRSAVREFDLARRLVYHAVTERVLPKHLEPDLVIFRDPRFYEIGEEGLQQLARDVTDRNYRLFAERGDIHVINGSMYLRGTDPFALFAEMLERDPKLDASHAFYLGYEMSKAVTALTVGKNYTQDQALRWGFLTVPEMDGGHRRAQGLKPAP